MLNAAPEPLSERQAEIAAMVARGNSNREIASTLGLSPRTVEAHVVAIFNKLGVRSRLELTVALLHPAGESPSLHLNRNNLPQKSTSFIGRENEIAAIRSILETHRLVTLVGSA
ncbi:MAG: helix-turn-helix transcriptional regulator, partial [Candidatus Eremiobacteraeota bacterium]|nr:helix-turn-helix transcriptional regulator [Candidatus Eremiobacteraeota bacterium]